MFQAHEAQKADPPCAPQAEEDVFTGWERTRGAKEHTHVLPGGQISTGGRRAARVMAKKERGSTEPCLRRESSTRPSPNRMKRFGKSPHGSVRGRRGYRRLTDVTRAEFLGHLIYVVMQRTPAMTGNRKSKPGGNPGVVASSHGQEGRRQGPRTSVLGTAPEGENRSEHGGSRLSRKGSWSRCCAWVVDSRVAVDAA